MKNADVSSAMLADKVRAVLDTGAEVVCAADNSCLMHIGGALSRQRTGVRTLHLAEVLAVVSFPDAARVALGDSQLRRNLKKATGTIRAKRARGRGRAAGLAELRAAGSAIKDATLLGLDASLERLEAEVRAAGGRCTGGERRRGGVRDRGWHRALALGRRGREGQVDSDG